MLSTHRFRSFVAAPPERVWAALTDGRQTARWLRGMALDADWRPGGRLELARGDVVAARGEVLDVTPPRRLALAVDGGHGPATYLTWEIRAVDGGSIVHLDVDEPVEAGDGGREAEEAWLPVLAGLQALVAAPVAG
jgi:uncharacterized protein YndB with AHSA1/START domain